MDTLLRILIFGLGLAIVIGTLFSAISTFVLPRSAPSPLNRFLFGFLRRVFEKLMRFAKTFEQKDSIFAYYAPIGLMLLVPTWYALMAIGYAAMYWSLDIGDIYTSLGLSGSSLLTLGFATSDVFLVKLLIFSEATLGLILVALLIAYLPTMYSAFSRREEFVNLLEVRAGSPPSSVEMLLRFNRIDGLEKLANYWASWETWFAALEESHTTLPMLVFFRSPRSEHSWVTASGTILDAAALSLSALDAPFESSAALCLRAGFLSLGKIAGYFKIPYPENPQFPETTISINQEEFLAVLDQLEEAGIPIKEDRAQAWQDFAGWRVNYDYALLALSNLIMAPTAFWSSDRTPEKT
ncbi:MAG: hypothetical protein HN736_01475 [Anaerolineae bacterium]|jgi:hypothetical protein|nr:hypothetical protein [Anaerolineae bacterium]MBT3713273.1 hypothetical protein [Anaerolineae bacterium]MBT4311897.1 hypothetical protein [Anaerolineae bacterium]MBT4459184.1 hypothetical protein [Anaerolineae bacterium]MBT4841413.1 hypothetical protein [Anaerolineae bacterium]